MQPVVVAEALVKRYRSRVAVDGISFAVDAGEVFAVLGPNGAGKTTTVEMLEGFRRPDSGRASVLGLDPRGDHRRLRHRVGVMPQDGGLYNGITASEAVRLFASFYAHPQDPDGLIDRLGLAHARRTTYRRLSGGEKQRLSLALALVGRPEVAFLDEPTAGMDPHARATTWEVVAELRDRGTTVLLTTHLLEEAERLADRVAIVHRGTLVACGPPRELAAAGSELRFTAVPGLDGSALGITETSPGTYLLAGAEATPSLVAGVTAWLAERGVLVGELTVGRRSLEDVFLELTRDTST